MPSEARAWKKSGAREVNDLQWTERLQRARVALGKTPGDPRQEQKSAQWKLAIAAWMNLRTQVRNGWLANRLHLGPPAALGRNFTRYYRNCRENDRDWKRLKSISAA
ncbi:MAG: hypothetical protein ACREH8_13970 [Opitutaceae bacterium]